DHRRGALDGVQGPERAPDELHVVEAVLELQERRLELDEELAGLHLERTRELLETPRVGGHRATATSPIGQVGAQSLPPQNPAAASAAWIMDAPLPGIITILRSDWRAWRCAEHSSCKPATSTSVTAVVSISTSSLLPRASTSFALSSTMVS